MKIINEHGLGPEAIYIYWFPSQVSGERWPCKIGKATSPKRRIADVLSAMQEKPCVEIFWTENAFWLEQSIHAALSEFKIKSAREWFLTSPNEVILKISELADKVIEHKTIGQKIKATRVAAMTSQVELSKLTGIAQSTISDIERGAVDPQLSTIIRILDALNSKIDIIPA